MTSLSAEIRLRPTRIGFLVDPTDHASVRLCMNVCTCLWGGVYNPIIPVCDEIPEQWHVGLFSRLTGEALARGYVRFFEPDVFVEARPGLAANLGISDVDMEGHRRVLPFAAMLQEEADRRSWPPAGLSVTALYKKLYNQEYKFVTRQKRRVVLCDASNDVDAAFVDAAYGAFPKSGPLAQLSKHYREVFDAKVVKATAKIWEKAFREGFQFPLSIGREGLERSVSDGGWRGPTVFVADPSSVLDLIDLWNIRLFRSNVFAVSTRWFSASAHPLSEFIAANHRPLPGNPHGVMIRTTVEFGRSIDEERATSMVEEAGLTTLQKGSWASKLWYDRLWEERQNEQTWSPKRARVTAKTERLDLTVSDSDGDRSVKFLGLAPDFAPEFLSSSAAWVNVLQFRQYGAHSELALSLPTDYDLVRTYRLRSGGVVLPSREGLVLPQHYRNHSEYFRLPTGREAMIDWLKQHGLDAVVSKAGRVSEQVLGAVNGIQGSRLLAHRETVELLNRMAKSVRKYADGTVEEYQDRTAAAREWTALLSKRTKNIWVRHLTLDDFVQRNILKLGLAIQCSHCTSVNWYGIADLNESVICDRCRKSYRFPQGSIGFTNSPWKFRVVGPFSVPDYADGAYATVLALRVFAQTLSGMHASVVYAPGLDLTTEQESSIEVDFALWYSRDELGLDESETVTVFGESKSFGLKCFHSDDVARMRRVAEKFPGAFLVFAAMKNELHADEKRAIAEFASWGREPLDGGRPRAPVIVLMGTELFAPWKVDNAWKELGGLRQQIAEAGHIRLDNLWELADATQQIYLGMKSRSAELQEQWEAARASAEASTSLLQKNRRASSRPTTKRTGATPATRKTKRNL